MSEEKDIVERALLDDLERQNPDMQQDPERDTVWLSGGATPQTCGTFINVHDLAEAVEAALARQAASEITRLRGEVLGWQEIAADRQAAHSMAVHDYGELHSEAERLRGEVERLRGALTCIHEAKAYGTDQDCLNDLIDDNRTTARRALNLQGE